MKRRSTSILVRDAMGALELMRQNIQALLAAYEEQQRALASLKEELRIRTQERDRQWEIAAAVSDVMFRQGEKIAQLQLLVSILEGPR